MQERLERKAAVVSFTKGKGKVVMFGFRVQHRAQTEGTYQMLFNANRMVVVDLFKFPNPGMKGNTYGHRSF